MFFFLAYKVKVYSSRLLATTCNQSKLPALSEGQGQLVPATEPCPSYGRPWWTNTWRRPGGHPSENSDCPSSSPLFRDATIHSRATGCPNRPTIVVGYHRQHLPTSIRIDYTVSGRTPGFTRTDRYQNNPQAPSVRWLQLPWRWRYGRRWRSVMPPLIIRPRHFNFIFIYLFLQTVVQLK